jgi:hypothetical protein
MPTLPHKVAWAEGIARAAADLCARQCRMRGDLGLQIERRTTAWACARDAAREVGATLKWRCGNGRSEVAEGCVCAKGIVSRKFTMRRRILRTGLTQLCAVFLLPEEPLGMLKEPVDYDRSIGAT